jgi:hypothetical protein
LGAFVEMVCADALVEGAIFEHAVRGSEDGSSDSTDGLLVAAAGSNAQVLSVEVSFLGARGAHAYWTRVVLSQGAPFSCVWSGVFQRFRRSWGTVRPRKSDRHEFG